MPDSQRQLIDAALRRFEKLKPAYASLAYANQNLHEVIRKDSAIQVGQGRIISWYRSAYSEEQRLRQDSNAKQQAWKHKAKKRGWLVAIETVGLALAGYVILTK